MCFCSLAAAAVAQSDVSTTPRVVRFTFTPGVGLAITAESEAPSELPAKPGGATDALPRPAVAEQ